MKLHKVLEHEFEGVPPYSFVLTVHKPAGWDWLTPFEKFDGGTIWTGMRALDRVIGIRAESLGSVERPRIRTVVYSDDVLTNEEEGVILEKLAFCLRLDEDISEFYALVEDDPLIKQVRDDLFGMRDTPYPDIFTGSILAIALQWASIKRSMEMREAVYREYGDALNFEGKRIILSPSPHRIALEDARDLKDRCHLGYRATHIKSVAEAIVSGDVPTMEELAKMPPGEAKKELLKLKGIGDYSADIISPHRGFPVDVWSAKIFAKILGIGGDDTRGLIREVKTLAKERFGEWAGYVFVYVLNDLDRVHQ
ncbi:MAG: DNA-3-methyladenine glycosylase family protein [Candidatus Bathyarchaeia archaeon]